MANKVFFKFALILTVLTASNCAFAQVERGKKITKEEIKEWQDVLSKYASPVASPNFKNPEGFLIGAHNIVSGIFWTGASVSFMGTTALILNQAQDGASRKAGDQFLNITGINWDEEIQAFKGNGTYYGRGYVHCPLKAMPAKFVISIELGEPFKGAWRSVKTSFNSWHIDERCREVKQEKTEIVQNRTFTRVELIRAVEYWSEEFNRKHSEFNSKFFDLTTAANWLKLKLPPKDSRRPILENIVESGNKLKESWHELGNQFFDFERALKYKGKFKAPLGQEYDVPAEVDTFLNVDANYINAAGQFVHQTRLIEGQIATTKKATEKFEKLANEIVDMEFKKSKK